MENYHLNSINGRWKLSWDRSDVILAGFDSRREAVEFCAEMSRGKPAILNIHRPDGTVIERRNLYPGHAVPQQAA
jgi:hypothetical protein